MQGPRPERRSAKGVTFLCLHNRSMVQLLDGASAMLSAGALAIAVYFFATRDAG